MLGLGPVHIIILLLVIVLLFGTGRVSTLMGDVAKGIKSFKKGMAEDDEPAPRRISDERPVERPIATPEVTPAPPVQHGSASEADRH